MASPSFDRIASSYRWLEYLTFGRALEDCRFAQLKRMQSARRALVLGDGDGRFTARLLTINPHVRVVAIDSSQAMLRLLAQKAQRVNASDRVTLVAGDAVSLLEHQGKVSCTGPVGEFLQPALGADSDHAEFDLVVTNFFLDCLSTSQVQRLVRAVRPRLKPKALWVVAEFATPAPWATALVWLLYWAFWVLAGLPTQELPQYEWALRAEQFEPAVEARTLRGLLVSSVWVLSDAQPNRVRLRQPPRPPLPPTEHDDY